MTAVKPIAMLFGLLALWGCTMVASPPWGAPVGVALTLRFPAPLASADPSRVLLPNARRVEIVVEQQDGTVADKKSQGIAAGASSVTIVLSLPAQTPLTVIAKVYDASGTFIAAGEADLILQGNLAASLSLLPVEPAGNPWPTLSVGDQTAGGSVGSLNVLAPQQSATFRVVLGATASAFTRAALPATVQAYAQRANGVAVVATGPTVLRSALGGDTEFLLTFYNAGGSATSIAPLGAFTIPPVALTAVNQTILVGGSQLISLAVTPANADPLLATDFTWTSSNPALVSVDALGVATGVSAGAATITVTHKASPVSTTVAVTVSVPAAILVTGVTLDAPAATLTVGGTFTPVATVAPANATTKTLTWTSSNAGVASVNPASGLVTAVAPGTATITATTTDGAKTAAVTVTVTGGATLTLAVDGPESMAFNLTSATLDEGASLVVSTTNSVLAALGTGWSWTVDSAPASASLSGSQFTVDTSGFGPGTYDIEVFVTSNGVFYSGSLILTIQQKATP